MAHDGALRRKPAPVAGEGKPSGPVRLDIIDPARLAALNWHELVAMARQSPRFAPVALTRLARDARKKGDTEWAAAAQGALDELPERLDLSELEQLAANEAAFEAYLEYGSRHDGHPPLDFAAWHEMHAAQ